MGPGSSHITDGPFGPIDITDASQTAPDYSKLTQLEADYYALVDHAQRCVNDVLAQAEGFSASLQRQAEKCWEAKLDKAAKYLAKLEGKAADYAVARLSEAYMGSVRFGIRVPTIEELLQSYGDPVGPPGGGGDITTTTDPFKAKPCPQGFYPCYNSDKTLFGCVLPTVKMPDGSLNFPTKYLAWPDGIWFNVLPWTTACSNANVVDLSTSNLTSTPVNVPASQQAGMGSVYLPPLIWIPTGTIGSGGNAHGDLTVQPIQPGGGVPPSPITTTPSPTPPVGPGGMGGPGGTLTTTGPPPSQPCPCPAPAQQLPLPIPVTLHPEDKPPPSLPTSFGAPGERWPARPTIPPTEDYEWCNKIQLLTITFAAIGNEIGGGGALPWERIFGVSALTNIMPSAAVQGIIAGATGQYQAFTGGGMLSEFNDLLTAVGVCNVQQVIGLITCKRFFEFINSFIGSAECDVHADASARVGLPHLIELVSPVEGEAHGGSAAKAALKAELHLFVVPMLELIDICLKAACPTEAPGIPDAIETFIRGQIGEKHCRCLIELNGGVWDEWSKVIDARREQLNTDEIIRLWRRDKLDDKEVDKRLLRAGMLFDSERDEKRTLSEEWPPINDIIRFMVRNVYDQGIVDTFRLDDEFEQKYRDNLVKWAKAAGLPDDAIKAHWRAHWQIPSPTQLYEMLQRLRPEKYGDDIEGLRVTIDDLNRALGENDVLPFWRKRLVEIAYRPLTRIDSRRAYIAGLISREQFVSFTQDIGYKPETAGTIADFADEQRMKALRSHRLIKAYESYGLNRDTLMGLLSTENYTDDEITRAINEATQDAGFASQSKCVQDIVKRYQSGDLDDTEIRAKLHEYELDSDQIERITSICMKEKKAKERHETASTLCDWYSNGLINADEFVTRLVGAGYNSDDSINVLKRCNIKMAEKLQKEQEKAKKEAEKKEKEAQTALMKAELRRQDLAKLADKVAKINDSLTVEEAHRIRAGMNDVITGLGVNEEIAGRIALAARDKLPSKGPVNIRRLIQEAGEAWVYLRRGSAVGRTGEVPLEEFGASRPELQGG